ncbi:hypothetical protein TWF506_008676 [Arthrobotrys conoides]|uniref:Uncharacterized protein n=1 Tax=Arthrobotrys conoides TaxID=74498 RepID=A0AAN8RSC4_9PEZI
MVDDMDIDTPNHVAEAPDELPLGTQATVKAIPFPKAVLDKLIYSLEEGMDSKALDFLTHVSYAGISTPLKPYESKKGVLIPPPNVFSVITNISLHPNYTTRQIGNLETDAAIKASQYLRTLTRIAGATNCDLQTAWQFKRSKAFSSATLEDPTTRQTRNRNVVKTGAVGRKGRQKKTQQDIDVTPFANLDIANEDNVFNRCDDIWSVVGWALVCSCVYKKRWDVWRDFLELLIELLTNDFQERIDAAKDNPQAVDLQGSLITAVGFLPDLGGGAGYKRIVRAIFANGSEKSRNEWTPVFPKETKKPPKKEQSKWASNSILDSAKARRGDSNEDVLANLGANMADEYHKFRNNVNDNSEAYKEFRDKLATTGFLDEDDSEEEENGTGLAKKDSKSTLETHEEAVAIWGGVEAIIIRLKFMALVSEIGATYERALSYQKEKEMGALSEQKKQKQKNKKSIAKGKKGKNSQEAAVPFKQADREVSEQPETITVMTTPTKRGTVKLRTPQNFNQWGEEGRRPKGETTTPTKQSTPFPFPLPPTENLLPSPSSSPNPDEQKYSSLLRSSPVSEGYYETAPTSLCETTFFSTVDKLSSPLPSFCILPESLSPISPTPQSLQTFPFTFSFPLLHTPLPPLKELPFTFSFPFFKTPLPQPPPQSIEDLQLTSSPPSSLPSQTPTPPPSLLHLLQSPPQKQQSQPQNKPQKQQSNPPLQLTYVFSHDIPTLSCFYTEFTDTLRLLPIPQLLPFISTSYYPCRTNTAFRGTLLTSILQKSMTFQPPGGWSENTDGITDDILLHYYFPHVARGNDIESQVRMGNVLESLARLFHVTSKANGGGGLAWSVEMEEAVEEGIEARREKATAAFKKKKKPTEADKELMKMLGMAEGRLRVLVRIAKAASVRRD